MKKRPVPQPAVIKMMARSAFCLLFILLASSTAIADSGTVTVEFFYESGCLKCEKAAPTIEKIVGQYNSVNYSKHDVMDSFEYIQKYDITVVPTIVINKSLVISYYDYNDDIETLEKLLIEGIENAPPVPITRSDTEDTGKEIIPPASRKPTLDDSYILVLVAGLFAGFNPCLIAVMAFLSSVIISSSGTRRDLLTLVTGFCAGIFITYMVLGIGILNTVRYFPEIEAIVNLFMIGLIAFLGLWHFYDAYHLRTHSKSSFKNPTFLTNFMGEIKGKNILFLAFVAGGLFSLIKAPCVGAVYLAILEMLISGDKILEGALYLGIYNFGVVFPILILGTMLAFGLDPQRVSDFRNNRRVEIRLVTGITLIALAILLHLRII
ncbi:cytochrome c biogenesis protein CcdA [Methanolobus sp. ZRKC2]|uniref:cytochrome c biogenesis protein CcdA n=1 Tax=Methanolobus sp. ZRKC2 TaxID=3125783 RepID=UPI003249D1DB